MYSDPIFEQHLGFSTAILDEALEDKRRQREEERLKLLDRIGEALGKLSSEISFKEAYVFGSVTKPYRFLKDSDIDIAFVGLRDEDFFKAMAFLARMLCREVDVLTLEGHRMEGRVKEEGIPWKKQS